MRDAPSGYITSIQRSPSADLLLITSISGELCLYDTSIIGKEDSLGPIHGIRLGKPIICCEFYENYIIVGHPEGIAIYEIICNNEIELILFKYTECPQVVQMIKVNEDLNILIVGSSSGQMTIYNLPDMAILDILQMKDCKIQTFDNHGNYVVVATNKGVLILDISSKSMHILKEVESGFMYPITIDIKILNTETSSLKELPHNLTFAQTGIEGKVSVIKVIVESQAEPTVTINTAAMHAPISNSCTNPSGLMINHLESRFIFRAHRTTLNEGNVLIGPIYSLALINGYLVTCGYGGNQKSGSSSSVEGSICFWDIEKKKRLKLLKGFPQSIVCAQSWVTEDKQEILVCGCSDDSFKNMTFEMAKDYTVQPSSVVVVILQP